MLVDPPPRHAGTVLTTAPSLLPTDTARARGWAWCRCAQSCDPQGCRGRRRCHVDRPAGGGGAQYGAAHGAASRRTASRCTTSRCTLGGPIAFHAARADAAGCGLRPSGTLARTEGGRAHDGAKDGGAIGAHDGANDGGALAATALVECTRPPQVTIRRGRTRRRGRTHRQVASIRRQVAQTNGHQAGDGGLGEHGSRRVGRRCGAREARGYETQIQYPHCA